MAGFWSDLTTDASILSVASVLNELSGDIYYKYPLSNIIDDGEKHYLEIAEKLISKLLQSGIQIVETEVQCEPTENLT